MTDIVFQTRDINALALDAPGADTIVWDDLVARIDWETTLTEDSFGIDIPVISATATAYVHAHVGIEVTLTYDAGSFGIDYVLTDHADGFAEWKNERATPYTPPSDDPDPTPLAQYQNENPILAPTLQFVSGAMPFTAPTGPSSLKADFVYGMQAGIRDINLSADLWIKTVDIISDLDIPLVDIPDGRENIFDISTGEPIALDLGTFPLTIETLKVPDVVSDYGAVTYGEGPLPSLSRTGDGDPFFHASFSMAEFLANLFPAFKVLTGTYEIAGPETYVYWTLLDVQANVMVNLVQEVTFAAQGVREQVDTSFGQHMEGVMGDSFTIDTPQGQGRVDVEVLYTPYGEYRSRIGVVVSANLEVSAFEIGIHNTRFKDFDVSVGPLVHFFVPDENGWAADPIWLYENRRGVVLDGADSTDGVIGSKATYTAWYQNDVVGTDGNDTLQLNDEQTLFHALAGDDLIAGSYLYNNISGDDGADTLHGMGSGDLIGGGKGNDLIFGDAGNGLPKAFTTGFNKLPVNQGDDILAGGAGNDSLYGQGGNDLLGGGDLSTGASGSDLLDGGTGNDTLFSTTADGGADTLDGGIGFDRAVVSRRGMVAGVEIQANLAAILPDGTVLSNIEELHYAAGFGADTLRGWTGADSLDGGAGDDFILGGGGRNTLIGGAGDDRIGIADEAGTGKGDTADGGAGFDTLFYSGPGGKIGIVLAVSASMSFATGTTASNFEQIEFSSGAGSSGADAIAGGAGDDTIATWGGNDVIAGGGGFNVLDGGDGDDLLISTGIDVIAGGAGDDELLIVAPNVGFFGSSASWQFTFKANATQTLSNGTLVIGVEHIDWTGAGAADMVTGGDNTDSLMGAGGADTLDGGGGNDIVDGGSGDDVVVSMRGDGADTLAGGSGDDRLVLDLGDATGAVYVANWYGADAGSYVTGLLGVTQFSGFERLTFRGGAGNDVVQGGDAATSALAPRGSPALFGDRLYGGGGRDFLDGGDGRDALYGEDGDDQLVWSSGGDLIDGGAGEDLLWLDAGLGAPDRIVIAPLDADDGDSATNENETFLADGSRIANVEHLRYIGTGAGSGVDVHAGIFGDTLLGSRHADTLDGGRGADSLSGDRGADTLLGDQGGDSLRGGAGADLLDGGAGNDWLVADRDGAGGVDTLPGGVGAGGGGIIVDTGGGGPVRGALDTLLGGEGADTLVAETAAELDGGAGIDRLVMDRAGSEIGFTVDIAHPGLTTFLPGGGSITGIELLTFMGGRGGDRIAVAGAGPHDLNGGSFDGLSDQLELDLTAEAGGIVISVNRAGVIGFGAGRASNFESATVQFSAGADRLTAGTGAFTAWIADGGDGADTLSGAALDDNLSGGIGNDRVDGNDGADTLDGFIGLDMLRGGAGDDLIHGEGLQAGELYDAGAGIDTFTMQGDAVGTRIDLTSATATRAGQTATVRFFEIIEAGIGADTLYGSGAAETLRGGEGNDLLEGRGGADRLAGGEGDDTYIIKTAGAVIVEGINRGDDLVRASIDFVLDAQLERLVLQGTAVTGAGNALGNDITGNELANLLQGRDGDDRLNGRDGTDVLEGGLGNDMLLGGSGADTLVGGEGADTLRGEQGADVFVVGALGGVDRIAAFAFEDTILLDIASLDPVGAEGLVAGVLLASNFGYGGGGAWVVAQVGRALIFDADAVQNSGDEITLAEIYGKAPLLGDIVLG